MTRENQTHDDTTESKDRKESSLGLTPAQVVGSALAAMSVAFFASWAGTAGPGVAGPAGTAVAPARAAPHTPGAQPPPEGSRRTAGPLRQPAREAGRPPPAGAPR